MPLPAQHLYTGSICGVRRRRYHSAGVSVPLSLSPSRSQLRVELASALRQQEYDSKERKRLEEGKGELESKLKEVEAKLAHMSTALHAAQVSVRRSSHACVMRHPTPGPKPMLERRRAVLGADSALRNMV